MRKWLAPALGLIAAGGLVLVAAGVMLHWRELSIAGAAISIAVFFGCFITFQVQWIMQDWEEHRDRPKSRH